MKAYESSVGHDNFIERHNLWNQEQKEISRAVIEKAKKQNLQVVRLSFADQHGILRGKIVFVDYVLRLKEAETVRFLAHVTDWEQREYFEIF